MSVRRSLGRSWRRLFLRLDVGRRLPKLLLRSVDGLLSLLHQVSLLTRVEILLVEELLDLLLSILLVLLDSLLSLRLDRILDVLDGFHGRLGDLSLCLLGKNRLVDKLFQLDLLLLFLISADVDPGGLAFILLNDHLFDFVASCLLGLRAELDLLVRFLRVNDRLLLGLCVNVLDLGRRLRRWRSRWLRHLHYLLLRGLLRLFHDRLGRLGCLGELHLGRRRRRRHYNLGWPGRGDLGNLWCFGCLDDFHRSVRNGFSTFGREVHLVTFWNPPQSFRSHYHPYLLGLGDLNWCFGFDWNGFGTVGGHDHLSTFGNLHWAFGSHYDFRALCWRFGNNFGFLWDGTGT